MGVCFLPDKTHLGGKLIKTQKGLKGGDTFLPAGKFLKLGKETTKPSKVPETNGKH